MAFAEVVSDPEIRTDEDNPSWVDQDDGKNHVARVAVRYTVPEGVPLWVDESDTGKFLRSLSVARSQGGTVFVVTAEQWKRLCKLAPYTPPVPEVIEATEQLRRPSETRGGQGFGLSGAERKAVENHAMSLARRHLSLQWDSVRDASARCSYDLLCKRDSDELRVEVKGTTTAGDHVLLTRKEVDEAEEPGYALFVVSGITLDKSDASAPVASGGTSRRFFPWCVDRGQLGPISYNCKLI